MTHVTTVTTKNGRR